MRVRRMLTALLLAAGLGGCSGADVLNTLASGRGVAATPDIAYADGPGRRLDLYTPATPAPGAPVVVFFHGGGWETGTPADYRFLGTALARHGVTAVIAGYRLYPEVRYPAFLEDAALATRWARDHAAGGGRVFVMGHSAGAYIAAMLALDGRWLGAVGMQPGRDLAGFVGLSGPYDFLPLRSETLKTIFGPEDQRPDTQPIRHLGPGAPPMFLATGCADTTVLPANSARLAAAQRAAGGIVVERSYPLLGRPLVHELTIGAFAGALGFVAQVREEVLAFLADPTAPPPPPQPCPAATG